MALLTLNQVTAGYAGRPLLHDVTFALAPGSLCCLLGANGSGKTTLLRSILGLQPVQHGEIFIDGVALRRFSAAQRARTLAWVPQAHNGAFAFNALDMVLMGLNPHMNTFSAPGPRARASAVQQLTEMGIAHLACRSWTALSGGEQQLILIARALIQRPRLLLLDEPASSLDFGHQINLLDTLRQLKAHGMTLLMATHHPLHARAIADSVLCIESDGRVTQGEPASQLGIDRLAALYRVTPEQIRQHLGITDR